MNRTMRIPRALAVGALIAALASVSFAPAAVARDEQPPVVRTLRPYGVNDIEAILNSEISPHGHEVVMRFQWGRTRHYGHITEVPEEDPYPYTQHQEWEEWIGGLRPRTVYHYRALASYEGKKAYGQDVAFRTHRP
jgi:hypothetical protein